MTKIILDTNAYIAYMKKDPFVFHQLSFSDKVYISIATIGELIYGYKSGNKERKNKENLENFISKPTVETIDITSETAEFYGHIKNLLRQNGTPIPENDVWVAAHTMETGSTIITYDKHFKKVPGLKIWEQI